MFWNILHVEMCYASIAQVKMSNFLAELNASSVGNLVLGKILELKSDYDFIDAEFWGGGGQADNEAGSSLNADFWGLIYSASCSHVLEQDTQTHLTPGGSIAAC